MACRQECSPEAWTWPIAASENSTWGGVMVNDSSDFRVDHMPFGGFKGSGLGREGVRFAAEAMTETKVVCFNLVNPV